MKTISLLVFAGLVSAAFGAGATNLRNSFKLPPELQNVSGNADAETLDRVEVATAHVRLKNLCLIGVLYGAGLCLLSGAAAGIAAGGRPVLGAGLGLLLGGLLGGVGGYLDFQMYNTLEAEHGSFATTVVAHGALWVTIALAFAATVRVAARRKVLGRLIVVCVLCGGIAAAAYPLLCAIVFPMTNPEKPLPDAGTAAMAWFVIPSLLMTLAAGRILAHHPSPAMADAAGGSEAG